MGRLRIKKKTGSGENEFQDGWYTKAFELFLYQLPDLPMPETQDEDSNRKAILDRLDLAFSAGYHTAAMALTVKERFGDPPAADPADLQRLSEAVLKAMIDCDKKRIFEHYHMTDQEKEAAIKDVLMLLKAADSNL